MSKETAASSKHCPFTDDDRVRAASTHHHPSRSSHRRIVSIVDARLRTASRSSAIFDGGGDTIFEARDDAAEGRSTLGGRTDR